MAVTAGVAPSVRPLHIAISPTSRHAELADVERKKRHHEREAGEAGEAGGRRDEDVAAALRSESDG